MFSQTDICHCNKPVTRQLLKHLKNNCPECKKPFKPSKSPISKSDISVVRSDDKTAVSDRVIRQVSTPRNHPTPHKIHLNPEVIIENTVEIPEDFSSIPHDIEVTDLDAASDILDGDEKSKSERSLTTRQKLQIYADNVLESESGSQDKLSDDNHIYEVPVIRGAILLRI